MQSSTCSSARCTHRMLGPPLPRSQENQHGFPCYLSHFATVRVQERGFSLHELLMPSLICFTHSYVFQILIITVFMLITSTALGARIHTHIHQLPSLKKKKSHPSHSGTLQRWYRQGRCTHAGCAVQPSAKAAPGSLGMPQEHVQIQPPLLCPAAALAPSALREHTGTACPGYHAETSPQMPPRQP